MLELKWNIEAFHLLKGLTPEPDLQASKLSEERELAVSIIITPLYGN